jgi:AcrR family transcriptional regulator
VTGGSDVSLEVWRRGQLLDATTSCIAEAGIERTTMRMVADRAGVTTGMLLYYFKNKKELVQAAVDSAYQRTLQRMDDISHSTFGMERLENVLRSCLVDPEDDLTRRVSIQIRKEALTNDDARIAYIRALNEARTRILKSVNVAQQSGQMTRAISPEATTDIIYCLMEGLATEMALVPEYISPNYAVDLGLKMLCLFAGMQSPPTLQPGTENPAVPGASHAHSESQETTPEILEAALLRDPRLSPEAAHELSRSFRAMYGIMVRAKDSPATDAPPALADSATGQGSSERL